MALHWWGNKHGTSDKWCYFCKGGKYEDIKPGQYVTCRSNHLNILCGWMDGAAKETREERGAETRRWSSTRWSGLKKFNVDYALSPSAHSISSLC